MSTDDLAAFLAARLDEDEARAAASRSLREKLDDPRRIISGDVRNGAEYAWLETGADPARVLREVAAKRLMLADHEGVHRCDWGEHRGGDFGPCKQARLLALPYAGHPDYDEDWAPMPAA